MMKNLLRQFIQQGILLCLFVTGVYSQGIVVTGTVTDQQGLTLPGVGVKVKGTTIGTATSGDGKFSIRAPNANSVLVFTYVGFTPAELPVPRNAKLNVTLEEALNNLEEVVVLGFGTQTKAEQVAAVSTINAEDIVKVPVGDVTNAITGRMVGVMTRQPIGRPGANAAQIFIRGRASANSSALIIVDGVERETFGDIDPNDIESISTLKDASSTALFGLKGANGVIVITTKRGREGKTQVSFSSSFGLSTFGQRPLPLRAYESVMLINEGQENIDRIGELGGAKTFTQQDIQTFKDGTGDPLLYPDVDWFDALTRDIWARTQHNLSFRGGSKKASFYIGIGYMFEDGIFKQFNTPSGYKTSPYAKRSNFRSNLDYNLTKTTKLSLNLAGRIENEYTVRPIASFNDPVGTQLSGSEALFDQIAGADSWNIPFFPEYTKRSTPEMIAQDDVYNQIASAGFGPISSTPYLSLKRGGYSMQERNVLESTFIVSQDLNMITNGLNFLGTFAYDQQTSNIRVQYGAGANYVVNRQTGKVENLFPSPTGLQINDPFDNRSGNTNGRLKTNLQLNLNYSRQFGVHKVSAATVATRELEPISGAAPIAFQGMVFRTAYNFKDKYYVEVNGSYQGSENYPKGERYGFFPTVGLGYTLTNEKFMENIKEDIKLDYLKVRGSYGMVGFGNFGNSNRFLYLDAYGSPSANGGYGEHYFGNPGSFGANNWDARPGGGGNRSGTGANVPVIGHTDIGNPFITWENSTKRNIGLEANFFNNRIQITTDLFDETREDILLPRTVSTPTIYGEGLPQFNFGKNYNKGYELEVRLANKSGAFDYGLNFQFSNIKNKRLILDEAPSEAANLRIAGTPIGQYTGYVVLPGFFQTQAEADAWPQYSGVRYIAGDLRFVDLNGDGEISELDYTTIGFSDLPELQYSLEPNVSYKGVRFSALFQAVDNVSNPFRVGGTNYEWDLDRWTPETPDAKFPAAGARGASNTFFNSGNVGLNSFYLQDASFIKLRNVEISYQIPQKFMSKLRIGGANIGITGQNLYTWTKFLGMDPETNDTRTLGVGNYTSRAVTYPNVRTYQMNLRVNF